MTPVRRTGLWLLALLAAAPLSAERPFRIVGLEAGADCHTVAEAIAAVPADNPAEKVILLQPGAFFGHTVLDKPHVTLRGSGPDSVLTYDWGQAMPGPDGEPVGWQGATTLRVTAAAHDTLLENLTIENTYGRGMQAQALTVEADRVVARRCRILGWQDTIRLESGRQFFDRCYLSGHVDFIYGAATAWFDHCEIFIRDQGYIAAPATPPGRVGFVFADCRVTSTYGNPPVYLGRPWHLSPSATFVRCELGACVRPEGWKEWNVKPPEVRFAEYQCTGPGAATDQRVAWATHSAGPPPAQFERAAVLGDWSPAP